MNEPVTVNGADLERIHALFLKVLNIDVDSFDTDLAETGLVDSLILVELLLHLEDEFKINVVVAELDIDDFRTVRTIGQLVARLRTAEGLG